MYKRQGFDNPDYIVDRIEAGAVYGAFLSDNTANDTINKMCIRDRFCAKTIAKVFVKSAG